MELSGLEEVRIVDHPKGLATPDPLETEAPATEARAVVPQGIEARVAVPQGTGVRAAELQVTEVPEAALQAQGVQDLAGVPEVVVQGVLALAGAQAAVHEVLVCAVPAVLHDLQEGHQEEAEAAAEEDNNHPNYSKSIITKR